MAAIDDIILEFEDMVGIPPKVLVVMNQYKELAYVTRDSIRFPRNIVALIRLRAARTIVLKDMLKDPLNHAS